MLARHDCLPDRTLPRQDRRDRRRHHPGCSDRRICDGPPAHLQMRLRQALAFRRRERRELAAFVRLVLAVAHHPRLHLLLAAVAHLAFRADVARLAARARRGDRGVVGGDREHRLRHQSLSRADDLARLLRRQRHQFGERHSVHGVRLLCRALVPSLAHCADRDRARAVRRLHDQGQSDAQRPDVRLAARTRCCTGSSRDRRARSRAGRGPRTP